MKKVGFVGWRGMVGSVLMGRMQELNDFSSIDSTFFSTSQSGQAAPEYVTNKTLQDANSIAELSKMDIILTCQGGDYTSAIHPKLRESGWNGYWIDAASTLRMKENSVIILDPVNRKVIDQAIDSGVKDFIGGNCTVSLMMMALGGLFENDAIEWLTSMTYQAASGGGARHMKELLTQMNTLGQTFTGMDQDQASDILEVDRIITETMNSKSMDTTCFSAPLGGSLIPWIDSPVDLGQTKEEWKGVSETNKILGRNQDNLIPVDGTCVRVGTMRCHSQAFTIKLKKDLSIEEIEKMISSHNDWVKVIPNNPEATRTALTPAAVSGNLEIPIGRLRKMNLGDRYLNAFTCGDQLLWGAAEPVRRMLNILVN
ncbi:aspartate-semialdehyde dehydrogenase [Halobacteriovorax sp. HLS]|uniref:aspartate-semialdehyde dehydrogenase n=1 Tax=Halobacteriovorax sp. HLS TaxID=2234000 RepID=UPI000FD8775D|nr:aspartate-semialdehyde dehydrogenase [Halobacteriovorax sp. HLS]